MIIVELDKETLKADGPCIQVEIREINDTEVSVVGYALLDTGANSSTLDEQIITQTGVSPLRNAKVRVQTATHEEGEIVSDLYKVSFYIEELDAHIEVSPIPTVNTLGQKFMGNPIIAILGRDFLQFFKFEYNGEGSFSLQLQKNPG